MRSVSDMMVPGGSCLCFLGTNPFEVLAALFGTLNPAPTASGISFWAFIQPPSISAGRAFTHEENLTNSDGCNYGSGVQPRVVENQAGSNRLVRVPHAFERLNADCARVLDRLDKTDQFVEGRDVCSALVDQIV